MENLQTMESNLGIKTADSEKERKAPRRGAKVMLGKPKEKQVKVRQQERLVMEQIEA